MNTAKLGTTQIPTATHGCGEATRLPKIQIRVVPEDLAWLKRLARDNHASNLSLAVRTIFAAARAQGGAK
jgi:hypothetical protein